MPAETPEPPIGFVSRAGRTFVAIAAVECFGDMYCEGPPLARLSTGSALLAKETVSSTRSTHRLHTPPAPPP